MNEYFNQIRNGIDELMPQKEQVIVAIDGNCTAGKTTLARKLADIHGCNVFHMDDFFLRPEQRPQSGMQRLAATWIMSGSWQKCCYL